MGTPDLLGSELAHLDNSSLVAHKSWYHVPGGRFAPRLHDCPASMLSYLTTEIKLVQKACPHHEYCIQHLHTFLRSVWRLYQISFHYFSFILFWFTHFL